MTSKKLVLQVVVSLGIAHEVISALFIASVHFVSLTISLPKKVGALDAVN
jgi:hypothetical protein